MSRVLFVFFFLAFFFLHFCVLHVPVFSESSSLGCRFAFLTLFKTRVWFGWEGGLIQIDLCGRGGISWNNSLVNPSLKLNAK